MKRDLFEALKDAIARENEADQSFWDTVLMSTDVLYWIDNKTCINLGPYNNPRD